MSEQCCRGCAALLDRFSGSWLWLLQEPPALSQVYVHRLRRYIGAYLVHLEGRVDAVIFSAGMGENNALLRGRALSGLQVYPS